MKNKGMATSTILKLILWVLIILIGLYFLSKIILGKNIIISIFS